MSADVQDDVDDENILELSVGAWNEARAIEDPIYRFVACGIVLTITVVVPALFVLMLLSMIGVIPA